LLVADVGELLKGFEIQTAFNALETFLEVGFGYSEETADNFFLDGGYFGGPGRQGRCEDLLHCAPEPAKLLIADVAIGVDIDDGIEHVDLFFGEGVGLVCLCAVDPEGGEGEVVVALGEEIEDGVHGEVVVG
jgi:hypothetical protein